ncbi:hypothetical protein MA16_Dca024127 [Dendrobium catenatum]|uniref:Uncharacterized protein n=1 Tax=Dendrobium catenatum TaxID=906689 RepID=A0A2I0V807_9ASPA|nr:hypothetical protein MA16_Dca024127 [Dendrobium catenatum]
MSPPRHPLTRSGGEKDVRGGKRTGGGSSRRDDVKTVVGGNAVGANVYSSCSDGSERRFSLPVLGSIMELESGGGRMEHARPPSRAGSTRSGGADEVMDAGNDLVSSKEMEIETLAGEQGMVERDLSLQGSSDRDEVMEIIGVSETDDFLREVTASIGATDQLEKNEIDSMLDSGEIVLEKVGELESGKKTSFAYVEGSGVNKVMDNPIFEHDLPLFMFGSMSRIKDLSKVSLPLEVDAAGTKVERGKPCLNFGVLGKLPKVIELQMDRGERVGLGCNDTLNNAECKAGVCGYVPIDEFPSIQTWKTPIVGKTIKHENVEMKAASNAWKKSTAVKLSVVDKVDSFLRKDGLVSLDLNKARSNIQNGGSYGERRLSFGSTGGLAEIGAEGSRLVQDWAFVVVRGARSGVSGQGTAASVKSDVETVIMGAGSGASELDDVMEVIGGSEVEEFLREVSTAGVDMEQADSNPGVQECTTGALQEGSLNPKTEELRESNARGEESRMVDNPMFEPNKVMFNFGNVGRIGDLKKFSLVWNEMEAKKKVEGITPVFNFGLSNAAKETGQVSRREHVDAEGCGLVMDTVCSSGVWGNVSSGSQQDVQTPSITRPVKKEVDEIGAAFNAWKKSTAVQLSLVDVGRNSIVTKEIAQIGCILRMPRMKRKAIDAELSASTFEHLISVRDELGCLTDKEKAMGIQNSQHSLEIGEQMNSHEMVMGVVEERMFEEGKGSSLRDDVKTVVGGNAVGANVYISCGDGSERRFSLSCLGGIVELESGGGRMEHARPPSRDGSTRSGGADEVMDARNDLVSSKELEIETLAGEQGMVERDLSLQGSSDRDEVMEIIGVSETDDFLREVTASIGATDQLEKNEIDSMLDSGEIILEVDNCGGVDHSGSEKWLWSSKALQEI